MPVLPAGLLFATGPSRPDAQPVTQANSNHITTEPKPRVLSRPRLTMGLTYDRRSLLHLQENRNNDGSSYIEVYQPDTSKLCLLNAVRPGAFAAQPSAPDDVLFTVAQVADGLLILQVLENFHVQCIIQTVFIWGVGGFPKVRPFQGRLLRWLSGTSVEYGPRDCLYKGMLSAVKHHLQKHQRAI